jgi:tight adherence protein C
MDDTFDTLTGMFSDPSVLMLAVLVFLAAAVLTYGMMAAVRVRGAVKRRAAGIGETLDGESANERGSLRQTSLKAAQRLLEYTTKHYGSGDQSDAKILRQRLIRAGIFDSRAVGYFFAGRIVLSIGLAFAAFVAIPTFFNLSSSMHWLAVMVFGVLGYVGPSLYLDRRIGSRRDQHRVGFPDFMDLLVVCADSGLSMEASLERVGRELADSYPSLGANIHMANLEIRAGRSMTDALEHLGDRLGLDEARSFATLIQQSAELGSSITDALRVYSDDMRHKRLSRAEEKAYSLPAKLSVPMMVCIFPVLFVVILLPVVVRLYTHHY